MIAFKCITSFTPTQHGIFDKGRPAKRKNFILLSKSNDSDSAAPTPDGDLQKQELLAKIAMLQTQKVRLTGFLDERSDYLTQFAEEANAEIDQIGEEALKELEETSARIMGNLESQMQAFEESAESSKLALIGLLSIGIVDSLISSSDYRKALVLGVLLIGVLSQVINYGLRISPFFRVCNSWHSVLML